MSVKVVFVNERGFITDLQLLEAGDDTKRQSLRNRRIKLARYGVWQRDESGRSSRVTFSSNDLEECKSFLSGSPV